LYTSRKHDYVYLLSKPVWIVDSETTVPAAAAASRASELYQAIKRLPHVVDRESRPNSLFSVARTTDRQSHAQASRLGPLIQPEGTRSNIQQRKGPYLFGKSAQNKAIAHKRDLQGLLIYSVTPRDKTSGFSTP
jgi:hypothetical protein